LHISTLSSIGDTISSIRGTIGSKIWIEEWMETTNGELLKRTRNLISQAIGNKKHFSLLENAG
jgi:hypothetical protein